MQSALSPVEKTEEIVVVGAGPVGLATIAYFMKKAKENPSKKYKITLIDVRNFDFTRRGKFIVFKGDLVPGIEKGINWEDFCKELFDPSNELSKVDKQGALLSREGKPLDNLNERQRLLRKFLRSSLLNRGSTENFSIKSLQMSLLEYIDDPDNQTPNVEIEKYPETTITAIDLDEKSKEKMSVTVKSSGDEEKNIPVDTLLLCEGGQRAVTKLVNNAIISRGERPFEFKPFPSSYPFHCTVRLKLKSLDQIKSGRYRDYQTLVKEETGFGKKSMKVRLSELGWTDPDFPGIGLTTNFDPTLIEKKPLFCLSSEIPAAIFNMPEKTEEEKNKKKEVIIEWAKTLASFESDLPIDYFEFDAKRGDAINLRTFSVEGMQYIDRNVFENNRGHVVMMGDAAMSPYHPGGRGGMMGMNLGISVVDCIVSTTKNAAERFTPAIRKYHLFQHSQTMLMKKDGGIDRDPSQISKVSSKLFFAVFHEDNLEVVKELLRKNADPDVKMKGMSPLCIAIEKNHLDMVKELLRNGADPNADTSPLNFAVEKGNVQAIEILLTYGAVPNESIFLKAIENGNLEIIKKLLIGGAPLSPIVLIKQRLKNSKEIEAVVINEVTRLKDLISAVDGMIMLLRFKDIPTYIENREKMINELENAARKITLEVAMRSDKYLIEVSNGLDCIEKLDDLCRFPIIFKHERIKNCIEEAYGKINCSQYSQEKIFEEIREKLLLFKNEFAANTEKNSPTSLFASGIDRNRENQLKEIEELIQCIDVQCSKLPLRK